MSTKFQKMKKKIGDVYLAWVIFIFTVVSLTIISYNCSQVSVEESKSIAMIGVGITAFLLVVMFIVLFRMQKKKFE